ncbi:MAG: EAL domain-containing protein [Methylococcales bacterium]
MLHSETYSLSDLLKLFSVTMFYTLLAKYSLDYFAGPGVISIIWPPSGLALAIVLIGGNQYALSVFLGAFLVNAISSIPFGTSIGIAFGSTLEALSGAYLLTRNDKLYFTPNTLRDYLRLIFLAGCIGSGIAALIGSTVLLLTGFLDTDTYFNGLRNWWMGDALGIILITPAILVWIQPQNNKFDIKQVPEAILAICATFLAGQIIFLDWFHDSIGHFAKDYWMFLFITWTAVRLETRGVLIVLIMIAAQALWGTYHGTGFFIQDNPGSQLINYWFYMVILSIIGMVLATFFADHKSAETKIQRLAQLYAALSQCNQAIVRCNNEAELFPQICRDSVIFGGMKLVWISLIDPQTKALRIVASFGADQECLESKQASAIAKASYAPEPTEIAIRENQPYWCQDLQNDTKATPWHDSCQLLGLRSFAVLPVCRNGVPVGTFTLFSAELAAFDAAGRHLLIEMAMDINYALDNFEREAERKKAEIALQKSEHYLRMIIETEPECVKVVGRNGELMDMNRAGLAMLEAESVSEVQQRSLLEAIVPEYRNAFIALHKRVMHGEKGILEFEIIGLRGTPRWLETHATPLRDETGEIIQLLGITRDITLGKQAEKALRESEQRLALVIKGSHDAPWDWNLETQQMYYSPQWWRMLGYQEHELPSDEGLWLRLLHPDDVQNVTQKLDEVLQSNRGNIHYELRLRHKKNHYVPVLTRGFISRDSSGKALRVSGTNMDLTERHRTQELEELRIFLLELLTSGLSLEAIMKAIVLKLESLNPKALCSILLIDDEGKIKHGAAPSLPDFYNHAIEGQLTGVGFGSCGNAMATGQRTIVEDIASHPYWLKYKALAEKAGLASCWSEPIKSGKNETLGSFAIYHHDRASPSTHDIKLIEMTAHFIALAIERTRIETQLRLTAKVFDQSHEGFMVTDAEHNIILVNHAFTLITGYSKHEILGKNASMLSSSHYDQDFYRTLLQSIDAEGYWQGEIWNRRKNGEAYPELLNISAVHDASGKVTEYIGVFADITQLKASETQLEFLAHHDPLTALPNRLRLFFRLQHGIDMARRENKQLALLMLDLDRFKDVNDSFGHLAGDQLLQMVAARLTNRLRDIDTVARLGGDEFTVLLEDITHPEDAARVAEEIIADLSEPWELPLSGEVLIGVSIGISLYPQHGNTPEILLQQADAAMYQAKERGRNCFAYFSDDLTRTARERIELEARLRRAITQNYLRVYYQPQIDMISGLIVGAEALVRWQDPIEGLILPARFIPVAEQTGLITALGAWVLRETCRQGRQWLDEGLPPLNLAVNVSLHQLRQGDINNLVATVLAETGFPAGYLELELTESGLMERALEAVELLNNLRTQGVRLAIDDFGTGYSSLAYLKRFPLNVLKIDKSFIDDIPNHKDDMEIAAAIVAMGHTLGFKVLAEGVETQEQLNFLKAQGCDLYQGYLCSRPLPANDFAAFLREFQ